jgi:Putative DNA-binding domain
VRPLRPLASEIVAARVRIDANGDFEVAGHGTIAHLGTMGLDAPEHFALGTVAGAGPASLRSLRQALIRWRRKEFEEFSKGGRQIPHGPDDSVWVGLIAMSEKDLSSQDLSPPLGFGDDFMRTPPTSPALFLEGDRLRIRIEVWRGEEPDVEAVRHQITPFLERNKATCDVTAMPYDASWHERFDDQGLIVAVDIDWKSPPRGATVAEAWKLGDEAAALLEATQGDEIPQSTALDLLSGGRWDLFVGQPESEWLEAKGEPYDHLRKKLGKQWRYELAKDVAAFANSPEGGIIVIGLSTQDKGDGDVIDGVLEFDLDRVEGPVYRRHISQLVYPRLTGFEVRRIEGSAKGRGLAVLVIPPQPEPSRPFLVSGLIRQDRLWGKFTFLPFRRGDVTDLIETEALHTRIRLGEQVIAGRKWN